MVVLEEAARKELDAYFADKEKSAIRIYLAPGGCSGPMLGLALDEVGDDDSHTDVDGYTFAMNNTLYEQVLGVTISLQHGGFIITPDQPLPAMSGGGCGCSSGGGGCGSGGGCCG